MNEVLKFHSSDKEFQVVHRFSRVAALKLAGNKFLLVSGDMSGIQDFIFNIATDEKVARALKGRSFFVQLLSEVCLQLLFDNLSVDESHLILNSGGNFLLLVPAEKEKALEECKKRIDSALKEEALYLALGWAECTRESLEKNFSEVLNAAKSKSADAKKRKLSSLSALEVFSPFPQQNQDNYHYDQLADELINAKGYVISKEQSSKQGWQKPLKEIGYEVKFVNQSSKSAVQFNPNSSDSQWKSYRFVVKDLPKSDFDGLAKHAKERTGTSKLAVLKMDVDNLGKLFKESLPENQRSATEIAKISRALALFFEGEMSVFLKDKQFKDDIYPIFSGGDDFFIVGAWDKVFEFAEFIQKQFRKFVHDNSVLTLSASLLVVDAKFPVARFAPLADERLDDAKLNGGKNCINVFDINLSWNDFTEAKKLKEKLVKLIDELKESRAIIEKVQKSSVGLDKILRQVGEKRKVDIERVWRLAYYLRVTRKEDSKKIVAEILNQYEQLIFGALKGEKVNPSLVSVAARWAEFETRKKIESQQES